jgi:hypothetical protein
MIVAPVACFVTRNVCDTCLKVVIDKVQEKRKRLLADDRWCLEAQEHLQNGAVPEKFLGHCCEWALHEKEGAKAASSAAKPRRHDGHLVLPEHGLLLDSPLNGDRVSRVNDAKACFAFLPSGEFSASPGARP